MNNSGAGGGMIMTNSNMTMAGAMGGGGLVVSSSINKQPLPAAGVNMLAPGQQHHPASHAVPQVSYHHTILLNYFLLLYYVLFLYIVILYDFYIMKGCFLNCL